jgi:cytochrome oxidase Cu insertion factor (SCO1/SenC/PrrC family)
MNASTRTCGPILKRGAALLLAFASATALAAEPAHEHAHEHGAVATTAAELPALSGDSVYQLDVDLTDQDGRVQPWKQRRGQPMLVSMFYTSCQ